MINVLYGIDELIENYIKDFIKNNKIDNVIKYDYNDISIDNILEEVSYPDLFGGSKLIILYNAKFLTSEETLDNISFENYINNPNKDVFLFLVVSTNLDERKKIVKLLRNKSKVIELNKFNEYDAIEYIKNSFKKDNYKIDDKSIKEIINRLSLNITMYDNEINKLKLYKIDNKEVTYDDVLLVVSKMPEDNVFKLVDAVIDGNKELIFELYNDLKSIGTDDISLIALLASQFRFMYQVKVLLNDGLNKNQISSALSSHPYKTELTIKKVMSYREDKILDYLYKLSLIDINIKSGVDTSSTALQNFFLNL